MKETKLKQLKFYLEPRQYEKLITVAKQNNISPAAMSKSIVLEKIGEQRSLPISNQYYEQMQKKTEQLSQEVARMEQELSLLQRQRDSLVSDRDKTQNKLRDLEVRINVLERKEQSAN